MSGEGTHKLTIDGNATTDTGTQSVAVAPTQIAVTFPDEHEPTVEQGVVTADPAPPAEDPEPSAGSSKGPDRDAETNANEPGQAQAPSVGAALLAITLVAAAALRRTTT